jgi:hypothetical protein
MGRKFKYGLLILLIIFSGYVMSSRGSEKKPVNPTSDQGLSNLVQELKNISIKDLVEELTLRGIVGQTQTKKVPLPSKGAPSTMAFPLEALSKFDNKNILDALAVHTKSIYGPDDREEVFAVSDPGPKKNAESVIALFKKDRITNNLDGTAALKLDYFNCVPGKKTEILCTKEKFHNQYTGPIGTGVLIQPDLVATVSHCVNRSNLSDIRFVFGFKMKKGDVEPTSVNTKDIYEGHEVISPSGTDWVLIRLKKPVSDHPWASIRREGRVGNGNGLYIIGHPCGLPAKFAGNAHVGENTDKSSFFADLDAFHGNSGSPVFNEGSDIVEGLLLEGKPDFSLGQEEGGYCWSSIRIFGAGKEKCIRTTEFAGYLK